MSLVRIRLMERLCEMTRNIDVTSANEYEPRSAFRRHAGNWGPWRLDPDTYVIYPQDPYRYEIDLESCTSSAQVLDWIIQITEKNWGTDQVVAGLVRALDDLLQPQARLCSWGKSKHLTGQEIRQLVDRYVQHR